ncbi:MAG: hypothetical protein XD72_1755 [Methanothrix harundinacea]|uniref:Uncharacterized protein n=1 Tax=Methanothrix harundinacea TaxID=301375 RepID=A0A101IJ60_9EURY|nr:MAG: hypothetical protein XD72_1755 [Methanothrix harundinacea]KUK95983.1 MAG: hypothetical protein XE07_1419 [Methanothrix harundinacea]
MGIIDLIILLQIGAEEMVVAVASSAHHLDRRGDLLQDAKIVEPSGVVSAGDHDSTSAGD